MAGLTDMEELLATVPESEIRDYLREAMVCYGAGAYRGCVVLVHTALFEGLRQRLLALAPVNSAAKAVSAAIEPLASAQKVFELSLVQQMKTAAIITQLEADILEQLNKQRNKAAHPSGHKVTAEEARFVFSEAIQKFLSKPIRQTSVLVQNIVDRLDGPNFFPGSQLGDIKLIVDQETENLDAAAMPQLIAKLLGAIEGAQPDAAKNARRFLLALANRKEPSIRALIVKQFLDAKTADDTHATLVSTLTTSDPRLLDGLKPGTRVRVRALLLAHAQTVGVAVPYVELRNPAHVLAAIVAELGEAFATGNYKEFVDWILEQGPQAPEFVTALAGAPGLFGRLFAHYLARASSSQWDISNPFAAGAPALDAPLSNIVSDEEAFRLVVAIARGADWNGFGPLELANARFAALPGLKAKAVTFAGADSAGALQHIQQAGLTDTLADFVATYF